MAAAVQQTTNATPTWYDQLAGQMGNTSAGILNQINQLGSNWYNQPRVAGMDPLQVAAYNAAPGAVGAWQPELGRANNASDIALSMVSGIGGGGGGGGVGVGASNAASGLPDAQKMWGTAGKTLAGAIPQVQGASSFDSAELQKHLNPYLSGVLDTISDRGTQQLKEKLLPSVNASFTGSGMFGSSRNQDFTNRALRDTQREILGAQASAGTDAWKNAMSDYLGWGQLGERAGEAMGNIGSYQTNLGTTMAKTPADIAIGQAQVANQGAQIAQQGAANRVQAAAIAESIANQRAQQAMNERQAVWGDISDLYGMGAQNQALQQKAMDTSYGDWQQRLTTPLNMLGSLANTIGTYPSLYKGQTTQVNGVQQAPSSTLNSLMMLLKGING